MDTVLFLYKHILSSSLFDSSHINDITTHTGVLDNYQNQPIHLPHTLFSWYSIFTMFRYSVWVGFLTYWDTISKRSYVPCIEHQLDHICFCYYKFNEHLIATKPAAVVGQEFSIHLPRSLDTQAPNAVVCQNNNTLPHVSEPVTPTPYCHCACVFVISIT